MELLWALIGLNLKTALAMRSAFFFRLIFAVINHGFLLITWVFLFRAVPVIHDWNIWHLMFAYGLAWFAWGFVSFFTYGYKILPRTIEFGELDHFLLQPRPILLVLAANNGEVFGLPDMLLSLALLCLSSSKLHVSWYFVPFCAVSASLVFSCFTLFIGSLAFWLEDMHDWLSDTQYNLYVFATRPASAFGGWIKALMFTLLPIGFISYLPVEILRRQDPSLLLAELAGIAAMAVIAGFTFFRGLKRYGSGNRLGVRT